MQRFMFGVLLIVAIIIGHAYSSFAQEKIAFSSDRNGNYEIYTMDPTGSNLKRITNIAGDDIQPSWSPDGRFLVFCSDRDGDWDIYTMRVDGSGTRRLTNNSNSDKGPVWSPDGKSIAFNSFRDGNWEIYIMNSDGTNQHNITNSAATETYPSWSPDSRHVTYHYYNWQADDNNWEIYKIQANGANRSKLTTNTLVDLYPSWSPDGQSIAFWSNRNGDYNIYVMSSSGGNLRKISASPPQADVLSHVAWSADSQFIAFPRFGDIYKMKADGSLVVNLTPNSGTESYPSWISTSTWPILMSAVLSAASMPNYTARPASGVLNGRSSSQLTFINQRGYPDLFSLGFVTEGLDPSGHVKPLVTPRRIESWAYNGNTFSSFLFDNGYFIKETAWGPRANLLATHLKPTQFTQGMTEAKVIALMGRPSCVEIRSLAGKTYRYLRYNPTNNSPAATVVLGNGVLQSVNAGYALVDSSHTSTNLCTAQ